jgi:hypothetical protein
MSVWYSFHVGYGFLVDEDEVPFPKQWPDREEWFDGSIDAELFGSGLKSTICLNQMSGPTRWGFMAEGTTHEMSRDSNIEVYALADPDPSTVSNLWDIMHQVGVDARVGWLMWMDVN